MVFIDGHPDPSFVVQQITWTGRLNRCSAVIIRTNTGKDDDITVHRAVVAAPRLLTDHQTRWQVLTHGQLIPTGPLDSAGENQRFWSLLDYWSGALSRSPQPLSFGEPFATTPSTDTPSLSQALGRLSETYDVDLNHQALRHAVANAPLLVPLRLGGSLENVLEPILEAHGLFVRRDLRWSGATVVERRTVLPADSGRRITLPSPFAGKPTGSITEINNNSITPQAQRWVARGDRPRVESTFLLHPGWDPLLEGRSDTDYDRSQSIDFSRFANVYRRWVLNEDASLGDTEAFNLAGLFKQPALPPSSLNFEPCLTLDDAGRPLTPIVEFSLDRGNSWLRYTEPIRFLDGPAGLILDSTALPAEVLAAAQADDLRFRVTASLVSPQPIEARRWQGNPFADVGPEVVLDTSTGFAVRRVDPASLHAPGIQTGQLTADTRDDTKELAAWLLQQIDSSPQSNRTTNSRTQITLSNARPEIRIGDRLHGLLETDTQASARVQSVRCEFAEDARTILTLQP